MTFLAAPRFAFAGRFLSDVSTINNANPGADTGWNPQGGGAFDFLNCEVTGGWKASGNVSEDPALKYVISGRPDGSSAKMVDLDPDWQVATQLWAMRVRMFDPATSELALIGRYVVASFRDIWMRQCPEITLQQPLPNGMPMGARYVSTLTDVEWGPAASRSHLLSALRDISPNRLSIGFHQFGFFFTTNLPRYRTGTLIGVIGPSCREDVATALAGRRLQPVPLNPQLPCMGPVDFEVSPDHCAITMDLGHALPIANADGDLQDLGSWPALPQLAGCQSLVLGLAQSGFTLWKQPAKPVEQFGEIAPFGKNWYTRSGGVATLSFATELRPLVLQPMALYGRLADSTLIAITQEITNGLFVRTDNFVFRMEPGTEQTAVIHARKYGLPAPSVTIYLSAQTPLQPPALEFPASVVTDAAGMAFVALKAGDPGAPRPIPNPGQPAPDGQLYAIDYSPLPPSASGAVRDGTGLTSLDVLAVHVRQKLPIPDYPIWEDDVQPILEGYATLYPIMSKYLFDLADYDAIVAHRTMLQLVFNRDINDPNYMPVTRDLSESKRAIILKWLAHETGDPAAPLRRRSGSQTAAASRPLPAGRSPQPGTPDAKRDNAAPFVMPLASQESETPNDQG